MLMNSFYKTNPIVIHKPGVDAPLFNELKDLFFKVDYKGELPADLTILTWNTKETSLLERCLAKLNVSCVVLGRGLKDWKNPMKISLLNDALKEIKTDYIMGLDSFDVLFMGCPTQVLRRFREKGCDLLYNSGPINFPSDARPGLGSFELAVGGSHRFPYLNAGVFIGKTEFCREFFAYAYANGLKKKNESDWWDKSEQLHIKDIFPTYYPKIQLDYTCSIFQLIHPASPQDWLQVQPSFV